MRALRPSDIAALSRLDETDEIIWAPANMPRELDEDEQARLRAKSRPGKPRLRSVT